MNVVFVSSTSTPFVVGPTDRRSKRMSQEVSLDPLGDEFKGYVARVTGGNDKQGFPMKQGVLLAHRVRLLLSDGHSCYRPRKSGERRRKSVRGCIVGPDIAVLALAIVKQGDADIPGLTDQVLPKRLGPKRATKIRRFFALDKTDDVRKYVIRREVASKKEGGKAFVKAPKIQRLVTPQRLQQCVVVAPCLALTSAAAAISSRWSAARRPSRSSRSACTTRRWPSSPPTSRRPRSRASALPSCPRSRPQRQDG